MRRPPFPVLATAGVAVSLLSVSPPAMAQGTVSDLEQVFAWTSAGNGLTDNHDAPYEFLLGRGTLPTLAARWVFSADGEVQGTPTVQGNDIYFSDAGGSVWRLNALTGAVVWKASLPAITGNTMSYSRVSPAIASGVVIVADQASGTMFALGKSTGALVWRAVLDGNPEAIITSSPVVANGMVFAGVASEEETKADKTPGYVPDFRGSAVAVDLNDGHIVWKTYTVPAGYTGGAVWSSNAAVDLARSVIYTTSGNNYSVPAAVAACQAAAKTPTALDTCLSPDDHIDSILALDMKTGAIRWSQRFAHADTWTVSCNPAKQPAATPCPSPTGLDVDFGSGPNLFTVTANGRRTDAVGAGQKSGAYFALNRDTGAILWGTQASPDGPRGGIEWSTATDGARIYVPNANSGYVETTLISSGQKTNGGFWSALDVNTGQTLWQTPTFAPAPMPSSSRGQQPPPGALAEAEGSVSVANGVMYGEDAAGNFVALDAATGEILKTFQSGGAGVAGPAVSLGTLYWPSGYATIGTTNNKVYAFSPFGSIPFSF